MGHGFSCPYRVDQELTTTSNRCGVPIIIVLTKTDRLDSVGDELVSRGIVKGKGLTSALGRGGQNAYSTWNWDERVDWALAAIRVAGLMCKFALQAKYSCIQKLRIPLGRRRVRVLHHDREAEDVLHLAATHLAPLVYNTASAASTAIFTCCSVHEHCQVKLAVPFSLSGKPA